jgi:hypothetical protein
MDKLSGYTEVQLGDELRPIKFGMGAWQIIAEERGKELAKMFDGLNEYSYISWLAYGGMKFAALAGYTDLKPPISVHQVMDWLDKATPEIYAAIGKCFADSKVGGQTMREFIEKQTAGSDPSEKKKKPLKN